MKNNYVKLRTVITVLCSLFACELQAQAQFKMGNVKYIRQGDDGKGDLLSLGFLDGNNVLNVQAGGSVGIGTTEPKAQLHIVSTGTRSAAGQDITHNGLPNIKASFRITESSVSKNYEALFGVQVYGAASSVGSSSYRATNPFFALETSQDDMPIFMQVSNKNVLQVFREQVLIGPNLPFPLDGVIPYTNLGYRLGVRGRIVAESLTCKALSTWADYVFNGNFRLKPLSEVEAYIKKNKHLPDVPAEAELKETGVDVTEMLKIQMQKIEELTLYVIRQEKEIQELKGLLNKKEN